MCESMGAAWQKVLDIVNDLIKAVRTLLGLNQEDPQQEYIEALTAEQESESEQRSPSKYAGKYAHLAEDVRDEMMDYVAQAIEQGSQKGLRIDTDIVPSELFQSLSADIYDAMNSGELTIEIAETWFEDAEDDLQEELDAIDLRADVHAQLKLDSYQLPSFGTVGKLLAGLTGTSHAAGGIFSSATRFLQDDGMHTIGESSPEALLPLDTLWRKMGLIFDKTFAANLDNLRYNIMPPMPAATSSHASDEDLSERIAVSVREAVSGLTVELDKRKVGKILLPGMSRDMADDISNRRWTG